MSSSPPHTAATDQPSIDLDELVGRRLQARGRAQVQRILAAARQVLAERGPERATTNRIAEVAGISPGSLYQYFDDLDAIVHGVALQYLAEYERVVDTILPLPEGCDVDGAVTAVVDPLLGPKLADPVMVKLLDDPAPAASVAAGRARLRQRLHDHLVEVVTTVAPDARDPHIVAEVATAIFTGTLPHLLDADATDRDRWTSHMKTALRAYISSVVADD